MIRAILVAICCLVSLYGCSKPLSTSPDNSGNNGNGNGNLPATVKRPASLGIVGDTADVIKTVNGGIVLMGGGRDVDAAFKWMIERSGGGDVVIIRASGTDAYNPYVYALGAVNSVETLKIDSRELANNDTVATTIRNAEMLFIAGGDQSDYMRYWRGTKTGDAINYLLNEKKAPVGGTSAGCAILSGLYYSGENGGVTSAEALQDPFGNTITLYNNDFVKAPRLTQVIADQHFLTRSREGRSIVFLGRILKDWNIVAKGIAVDERTAVCIDKNGMAKVYGDYNPSRPYSYAYFILPDAARQPEVFQAGKKITWSNNKQALSVYEIPAAENGGGSFNLNTFTTSTASGGKLYWWWVEEGVVNKQEQ